MSDHNNYLGDLLEVAGISQDEMAAHLGLSQSQVSRYAKNSEDVSVKFYRAWEAYCGKVVSGKALDVGDPLDEINRRRELIENYCKVAPSVPADFPIDQLENGRSLLKTENLLEGIRRISRKPRLGLFGRFDMGKSRLANLLMGGDSLPSSYQPATSIACLVRHIDDKPDWQPELVWIFNAGFDLNRPDSEKHCQAHRLIGGGYEVLKEHGTHSGRKTPQFEDAASAVVYIDSPFLKGCDIIDLPGYKHEKSDDKRAEMAQQISDIIIYVSTAQGFMDGHDRSYLTQLIRNLPPVESAENGLQPLCNLFVVATRADIAKDSIGDILDKASSYSFDGIGDELRQRGGVLGVPIDETSYRSRFFTYSAEDLSLRKKLENSLHDLLTNIIPQNISAKMQSSMLQTKKAGTKSLQALVDTIQETLDHREQAHQEINKIVKQEPQRINTKNTHEQKIIEFIQELKKDSVSDVKETCSMWINAELVEDIIKNRYDDKKKATELAPTLIVERLQQRLGQKMKEKSERLSSEVDAFLSGYDISINESDVLKDSWDFNAKGAFAGALAGLGTFGALATWASVVAAGSNLGGYILAAKIVSALSALGISVGGTATVASVMSILGGPITIAAGIAVMTATIAASIFGDSWQKKLAKKMCKGMRENNIEEKITQNFNNFWDNTEKAFKHAAKETEEDFQRKLASLQEIAFNTNVDVLKQHLGAATELKDFFAGIPWRRIAQ